MFSYFPWHGFPWRQKGNIRYFMCIFPGATLMTWLKLSFYGRMTWMRPRSVAFLPLVRPWGHDEARQVPQLYCTQLYTTKVEVGDSDEARPRWRRWLGAVSQRCQYFSSAAMLCNTVTGQILKVVKGSDTISTPRITDGHGGGYAARRNMLIFFIHSLQRFCPQCGEKSSSKSFPPPQVMTCHVAPSDPSFTAWESFA